MGGKRRFLVSLPMLSLYGACAGAVLLNGVRNQWGTARWFAVMVGVVGAVAVISLNVLLRQGSRGKRAGAGGVLLFRRGGNAGCVAVSGR